MHPRSYTYASTAIGGVAENMACKMVHGRDRLSSVIVLNIIGSQLQRSHTAITSPVPVVITGETARRSPLRRRRHRTAVSESRLASHAFGWICCLVCSSCGGVRSCTLTALYTRTHTQWHTRTHEDWVWAWDSHTHRKTRSNGRPRQPPAPHRSMPLCWSIAWAKTAAGQTPCPTRGSSSA